MADVPIVVVHACSTVCQGWVGMVRFRVRIGGVAGTSNGRWKDHGATGGGAKERKGSEEILQNRQESRARRGSDFVHFIAYPGKALHVLSFSTSVILIATHHQFSL